MSNVWLRQKKGCEIVAGFFEFLVAIDLILLGIALVIAIFAKVSINRKP
jgi:hypothetical protein